jgi:hypothetical protein
MLWLNGKVDVIPGWANISLNLSSTFLVISFIALLVMNFDQYLATSYPIFHRTSVTKEKTFS